MSTPGYSLSATINETNVSEGVEMAYDRGNWYGFVSSRDNHKIFRLEYGSSLSNNPVVIDLGNIGGVVNGPKTIKLIKDKEKWYGFLINYGGSNLVRLDFGTNLNNTPTGTNIGNLDGWNTLRGIDIQPAGVNWVIAVSSFNNDKLTIIKLKDSITYVPTSSDKVSISNSLINGPMGIDLVEHEGLWYGVLASKDNNKLLHLDFGINVFNDPIINELGSLSVATDAKLIKEGTSFVAFASGSTSGLFRVDFGAEPTFKDSLSLVKVDDFGVWKGVYTTSLVRHSPSWSLFALSYIDKKLHRLNFKENDCAYVNSSYSTEAEPSGIQYATPGVYAISLTAYDEAGNRDELIKSVTVAENLAPTVEISTDNACISKTNNFSSEHLTPDQTITSYTWTFPDGSQQTTAEASYQFAEAGAYTVRLDVESDNSCSNFFEKEVIVYPEPQAAYGVSASQVCTNASVTFNNQTNYEADSVITYNWDFGDGATSTEENPAHEFAEPGTYTVTLSASIPGCSSTTTQTIQVQQGPQTLFAASPVCDGETILFENQTSGENITGYSWNLGDGTYSTLQNPEHVYDGPGTYSVVLKSANALGCETSFTQTVRVYSLPQPNFSNSPACEGVENTVQFSDASADADGNIMAWRWEFEMPDGSTLISNARDTAISYPVAGDFMVTLTTSTNWGCRQTIQKSLKVQALPQVQLDFGGTCVGEPAVLSDITDATGIGVLSRYWTIGNEVFTDSTFQYTFTEAGIYEVSLQLNLKNGCDVQDTFEVVIDPLPVADFSVRGACAGQLATLEALTASAEYVWTIEGKSMVSDGPVLQHTFASEGTYEVLLTVFDEQGCSNTLGKELVVGQLPVAAFSADRYQGVAPFTVNFSNLSEGSVAWGWLFGDAQQSSSKLENPAFTFTEIGDYSVQLIAYNEAGCADTVSHTISVLEPRYDVALNSLHKISKEQQLQLVLDLENKGTIQVYNMEIEISINNEYILNEQFTDTLEIGEQRNYPLSVALNEQGRRKLEFICVRLKPRLSLVPEELSVVNNEKCLNFNEGFIMQAPHPNPGSGQVTLSFVLPESGGSVVLELFTTQGSLVQKEVLQGMEPGFNQHTLDISSLGKGMFYVRCRYGAEQHSYRILKK